MLDVKHLHKNRQIKQNDTVHIYKNILTKLWIKIQDIDNDNNGTNYLFQLPNFIFGEPTYDRDIACAIIQRKLKKGGFHTQTFFTNNSYVILISWDDSFEISHSENEVNVNAGSNQLKMTSHLRRRHHSNKSQQKKQPKIQQTTQPKIQQNNKTKHISFTSN